MNTILAKLAALFAWVVGTEFSYLKRSHFVHAFLMKADHATRHDPGYPSHMYERYESIKSWVWGVSFLRGKGYCFWMFGRRVSLRGFTFEIAWRGFRYQRLHVKEFCTLAVGVYRGGNAGWMPLW